MADSRLQQRDSEQCNRQPDQHREVTAQREEGRRGVGQARRVQVPQGLRVA